MSSLSLLVSSLIPPHLTEALLTELQAEKLVTAHDLLFSHSALSDTLSDFKDKVLTFLASEGKAGDVAYNEAKQARSEANAGTRVITTFCELDNKLLDGGFRAGDIIELLGDAAADSGNTYLCLSTTLNHLKRHSTSFALWLDTAGTFSAEKAIQVLRSLSNEAEEGQLSDEQAVSILDRLIVAHVPNLASAAQAIQKARRADFNVGAMPKAEEDREASTKPAINVALAAEPDDNDVEGPSDSANASQQNNGIRMPAREHSIVSFMAASQMSQSQSRRSSSRVMLQQRETETSVNNQAQESPAAVVDTQEADETKNDPRGDAEPTASSSHPQLAIVVVDPITPLIKGILSGVTAEGHARMTAFMRLLRSVANSGTLVLLTNTLTSASGSYGSAARPTASNPHTPFSAYNPAIASRKGSLGPTFTFLTDFTICMTPAEAYFDKQQLQSQNTQQGKKMVVVEVWRSRRTNAARWTAISVPV